MAKHKSKPPEQFPKPPRVELLPTPVYCPFAPNISIEEARAGKTALPGDIKRRDDYPPLPLTVEQLPGTTWVNIYTGGSLTCGTIDYNNFGYPGPSGDSLFHTYDNGRVILFDIGLWWSAFMATPQEQNRFVVDNYIWINDRATPELIYKLKLYRLDYTVQGWLRRQEAARHNTITGNAKEEALVAVTEALEWADQHGFRKQPVWDLQTKILEGKPIQFNLF